MSKIELSAPIIGIHGKFAKGDNFHFRVNSRTGTAFMVVVEHPNKRPPSAAQTAHRKDFGRKAKAVKQWFADNAPSEALPKGTEEYQRLYKQYKSQHRIGSMFGFVFKKLFPKE